MKDFVVELPHNDEECLKALDEAAATGYKLLPRIQWGCMAGRHVGWASVEAASESEAQGLIGSTYLRDKATVTPVSKFTVEQIRGLHK